MDKKVPLDQFADALADILNDYKDGVIESAAEATKQAGQAGVNALKATSPHRKGGYAGGWTVKEEKTRVTSMVIIYNGKKPGLAHLLEHGHVTRNGTGREWPTESKTARPHIAKVEEQLIDTFERAITVEVS